MKKIRILLLLLLIVSLFMTLDLGYNFLASLVPSMNDGIGIRSIFIRLFVAEHEYSQATYLKVFMQSSIVSIILILVNFLAAINWFKGKLR